MARLVVDPDVFEFVDTVLMQPYITGVHLEELSCKKLAGCFAGKSIRELDIHNRTGANIIGLKNKDMHYILNPHADTTLTKYDQLFVLGTSDEITVLKDLIEKGV